MQPIPLLDVRRGGPIAHAMARSAAAAALRDACLSRAPRWTHGALTPIDKIVAGWLRRSSTDYCCELEHIAEILGFPGAMTLNLSYLFACTTSAEPMGDAAPRLRRSLDWPFNGLGRAVEIAWQRGPAGEFYNVTWPGAVGVLTGMAPGRFCAAVNQAPMRRRTSGIIGLPYDAALNLAHALRTESGWPPDHLLRLAFERCETFEDAIELLSREPLARPALFTLTGVRPDETAVIERRERSVRVLRGPVAVANDWQTPQDGWAARFGYANNELRKSTIRAFAPDDTPFVWAVKPVLNPTTRLLVEMSAGGDGELLARGYEYSAKRRQCEPATRDFRLYETATMEALLAA
jgi:hypothetical protein